MNTQTATPHTVSPALFLQFFTVREFQPIHTWGVASSSLKHFEIVTPNFEVIARSENQAEIQDLEMSLNFSLTVSQERGVDVNHFGA